MTTETKPQQSLPSRHLGCNPILAIVAIYQIIRGIFGESLPVPAGLDVVFRLCLIGGGVAALFTRSGRDFLLFMLYLSIPRIILQPSFYWPPVRFDSPVGFFAFIGLFQSSDFSQSRGFSVGLDVVYCVLLTLLKTSRF